MIRILSVVLIFVPAIGMAKDFVVTKVNAPRTMLSPTYVSISMHGLRFSGYPFMAATRSNLRKVSWDLTSFPAAHNEEVEVCYKVNGNEDTACIVATPGGADSTESFNMYGFNYSTSVMVRHQSGGGDLVMRPLGADKVTFHLSY
ncbi:hypothetical protein V2J67_11745 [Pseudomonas alliivorans]|nr:hypothetical protein [Pseudomonas alliivorans]